MHAITLALLGCQWLTAWDAPDRAGVLQAWNDAQPQIAADTIADALAAIDRSRTSTPPRAKRLLLFTAARCGPCQTLASSGYPWLRSGGWQVDDTTQAHIQTVDFDARPDLVRQYGIDRLPTAVLIRDGSEVRRVVGPDRSQLVSLYNGD